MSGSGHVVRTHAVVRTHHVAEVTITEPEAFEDEAAMCRYAEEKTTATILEALGTDAEVECVNSVISGE